MSSPHIMHTTRAANPSNLLLERMAPHIAFEFARFETAATPEMFMRGGEHGGLIREAFLIHFRNLLDFLYGTKKHGDDVLATDYTADTLWKPAPPSWLDDYRRRCNKLLAHLTYDRVRYEDQNNMAWELEEKIQHIRGEWASFMHSLPDERRAWFTYQPQALKS